MALKKNLFYNSLLSVSQILFPLISIPYISRVLNADGIGRINTMDSFSNFMVVVAELGLSTYAVRVISQLQNQESKRIARTNELISLHIISTLLVSLVYAIGLYFLWIKVHSVLMLSCSILFFCSNIFNCEWYYWGLEKFKYIAIRSIVIRALGIIAMFIFIQTEQDFEKYYAIIVGTLFGNIVLNAWQILPHFKFNFSALWYDFKACIPIYLIGFVHSVLIMLDTVIIGITSSFVMVAYYSNAIKLVRISGALITDSFTVFFPRTSALIHEKNEEGIQHIYARTIDLMVIATIPICIGIYVFAFDFSAIYFGEKMLPVYKNLHILAMFPIIKSFSLFYSKQILLSNNEDKITLKGYVLGALLFVLLSFGLSYWYQDIGNSIAILIAEVVMLVYFYIATKGYVNTFKQLSWQYVALFFCTFFVFLGIQQSATFLNLHGSLWYLIVEIICCMGLYVALLVFVFKNKLMLDAIGFIKHKYLSNE